MIVKDVAVKDVVIPKENGEFLPFFFLITNVLDYPYL